MHKVILFVLPIFLLGLNACSTSSQLNTQDIKERIAVQDRSKDIEQIIKASTKSIANINWIRTAEWKEFLQDIQTPEMLAMPPKAFAYAFNRKAKALPFTHFYLNLNAAATKSSTPKKKHFELEAIDASTALLTIRSFAADAAGMQQIVQQIQAAAYQKLIIDLRNNHGGTLDAAVVLGQFLTNQPIDAGLYLSRKWFLNHANYPNMQEVQKFPFLQDMSFGGFGRMLDQEEGFRMVLPPHGRPTFQGKVLILTSKFTASTCEPFVDLLQKTKRATLVGQKTAGAMLSGRYFKISDSLRLFLPVADYMTANGERIDKKGVTPDILTPSQEALDYAIKEAF